MSDSASTLRLFQELPDSYLGLYNQVLNIFTFFPKLPIEIRLKIWRLCFPEPREVYIGIRCFQDQILNTKPPWHSSDHDHPLPPTLHINSESRHETLRHYCLVWRKDLGEEKEDWRRPICFDVKRDLSYLQLGWMKDIALWSDWLRELDLRSGNLITENVGHLEVKQLHYFPKLMEKLREQARREELQEPGFMGKPALDGMFLFKNLHRISFTLWVDDWTIRKETAEPSLEECRSVIATYLEKNRDRFEDGKAPEVVVTRQIEYYEGSLSY